MLVWNFLVKLGSILPSSSSPQNDCNQGSGDNVATEYVEGMAASPSTPPTSSLPPPLVDVMDTSAYQSRPHSLVSSDNHDPLQVEGEEKGARVKEQDTSPAPGNVCVSLDEKVFDFLDDVIAGNTDKLRSAMAEEKLGRIPRLAHATQKAALSSSIGREGMISMRSIDKQAVAGISMDSHTALLSSGEGETADTARMHLSGSTHPLAAPRYVSSAARSLQEYELVAYLGTGTFAEVTLARHRTTNELFAIKKISKRKVQEEGCMQRTFTERKLLASLRHSFLVRMHRAFQSHMHLYLVLDFAQGGDLFYFSQQKRWVKDMHRWLRQMHYPYYRNIRRRRGSMTAGSTVPLDSGLFLLTSAAVTEQGALPSPMRSNEGPFTLSRPNRNAQIVSSSSICNSGSCNQEGQNPLHRVPNWSHGGVGQGSECASPNSPCLAVRSTAPREPPAGQFFPATSEHKAVGGGDDVAVVDPPLCTGGTCADDRCTGRGVIMDTAAAATSPSFSEQGPIACPHNAVETPRLSPLANGMQKVSAGALGTGADNARRASPLGGVAASPLSVSRPPSMTLSVHSAGAPHRLTQEDGVARGAPTVADISDSMLASSSACFTADDSRLPVRLIAFYAVEIALVLRYLHRNGFVYRDLKPENVLLRRDGHIMLTDFGVAKFRKGTTMASPSTTMGSPTSAYGPSKSPTPGQGDRASEKSLCPLPATDDEQRMASFTGTAQYMSPEMLQGLPHDSRTDWWSYGCVLFEWANGRKAFDSDNQFALFRSIVEADVVTLPGVDFYLTPLELHTYIAELHCMQQQHVLHLSQSHTKGCSSCASGAGTPITHPLCEVTGEGMAKGKFSDMLMRSSDAARLCIVSDPKRIGATTEVSIAPLGIGDVSVVATSLEQSIRSVQPTVTSGSFSEMPGPGRKATCATLNPSAFKVYARYATHQLHIAMTHLQDLILRLLDRRADHRLSGDDVLEHPFFKCPYVTSQLYQCISTPQGRRPPLCSISSSHFASESTFQSYTDAGASADLTHEVSGKEPICPVTLGSAEKCARCPLHLNHSLDTSCSQACVAFDFLQRHPVTHRPTNWEALFVDLKVLPFYKLRLRSRDDLRYFPSAVTAMGVSAAAEQQKRLREAKEQQRRTVWQMASAIERRSLEGTAAARAAFSQPPSAGMLPKSVSAPTGLHQWVDRLTEENLGPSKVDVKHTRALSADSQMGSYGHPVDHLDPHGRDGADGRATRSWERLLSKDSVCGPRSPVWSPSVATAHSMFNVAVHSLGVLVLPQPAEHHSRLQPSVALDERPAPATDFQDGTFKLDTRAHRRADHDLDNDDDNCIHASESRVSAQGSSMAPSSLPARSQCDPVDPDDPATVLARAATLPEEFVAAALATSHTHQLFLRSSEGMGYYECDACEEETLSSAGSGEDHHRGYSLPPVMVEACSDLPANPLLNNDGTTESIVPTTVPSEGLPGEAVGVCASNRQSGDTVPDRIAVEVGRGRRSPAGILGVRVQDRAEEGGDEVRFERTGMAHTTSPTVEDISDNEGLELHTNFLPFDADVHHDAGGCESDTVDEDFVGKRRSTRAGTLMFMKRGSVKVSLTSSVLRYCEQATFSTDGAGKGDLCHEDLTSESTTSSQLAPLNNAHFGHSRTSLGLPHDARPPSRSSVRTKSLSPSLSLSMSRNRYGVPVVSSCAPGVNGLLHSQGRADFSEIFTTTGDVPVLYSYDRCHDVLPAGDTLHGVAYEVEDDVMTGADASGNRFSRTRVVAFEATDVAYAEHRETVPAPVVSRDSDKLKLPSRWWSPPRVWHPRFGKPFCVVTRYPSLPTATGAGPDGKPLPQAELPQRSVTTRSHVAPPSHQHSDMAFYSGYTSTVSAVQESVWSWGVTQLSDAAAESDRSERASISPSLISEVPIPMEGYHNFGAALTAKISTTCPSTTSDEWVDGPIMPPPQPPDSWRHPVDVDRPLHCYSSLPSISHDEQHFLGFTYMGPTVVTLPDGIRSPAPSPVYHFASASTVAVEYGGTFNPLLPASRNPLETDSFNNSLATHSDGHHDRRHSLSASEGNVPFSSTVERDDLSDVKAHPPPSHTYI